MSRKRVGIVRWILIRKGIGVDEDEGELEVYSELAKTLRAGPGAAVAQVLPMIRNIYLQNSS